VQAERRGEEGKEKPGEKQPDQLWFYLAGRGERVGALFVTRAIFVSHKHKRNGGRTGFEKGRSNPERRACKTGHIDIRAKEGGANV